VLRFVWYHATTALLAFVADLCCTLLYALAGLREKKNEYTVHIQKRAISNSRSTVVARLINLLASVDERKDERVS
jgi:hypothetical protein